MLTKILLTQIREPFFNNILADIIATLAVITYVLTLYPGIWRELFSRIAIRFFIKYRPQLGIASCLLGCLHAIYSIRLSLIEHPNWLLSTRFHDCTSGIICLIIFVLLGVTSNRWMQNKLKKNWKCLHSLTYILPILLTWHIVAKVTEWSVFTQLCLIMLLSTSSLIILRFSRRIFAW